MGRVQKGKKYHQNPGYRGGVFRFVLDLKPSFVSDQSLEGSHVSRHNAAPGFNRGRVRQLLRQPLHLHRVSQEF